ncbi:sigma factor-like helix-turn-helix DNA-binding protein [Stutzerimonas stutzeri]|uniref:DNA-directed RNA polymerase specialized sigma subunit, sigma24 n=1 Tax=Stutzerimonas stutzeri RCH2 TaxID=644801 RepID=L0GS72_STUST|nr:sigma factor-like helix-turn-helix DNA-binding protein [Stutzerimonas stutzeri]AGA88235.1 DNA-directed RNA polymerase specialized sigma subunit, sigma24 [Stutzerimonas stutzeri RCH2]
MNEQNNKTDLFAADHSIYVGSPPVKRALTSQTAMDGHKTSHRVAQTRVWLSKAVTILLHIVTKPALAKADDHASRLREHRAEQVCAHPGELTLIAAALAQLPTRTRTAFELHRLRGYTLEQVARELDITAGMAHQAIRTALSRCAAALDGATKQP